MFFRQFLQRFYKNYKNCHICVVPTSDWHRTVNQKLKVYSLTNFSFKNFHLTSYVWLKKFQDNENRAAHSLFENSPNYFNFVALHLELPELVKKIEKENERHRPQTKACLNFIQQSLEYGNVGIENKQFSDLVITVSSLIPRMTNIELIAVLRALSLWSPTNSISSPHFKALWTGLDKECTRRLKLWKSDELFLVADCWFMLHLSRVTSFNSAVVRTLARNLPWLNEKELIYYLFLVNLQRKCHPWLLDKVENQLLKYFGVLSSEELRIAAIAFFKTKNPIKSEELILKIINRLQSDLSLSSSCLTSFAKILRLSSKTSLKTPYLKLLDHFAPLIKNLPIHTCVHLMLLTTPMLLHHRGLLQEVKVYVQEHLSELRLKDLKSLLFSLTLYPPTKHKENHKFCELIIHDLRSSNRRKEIMMYPQCLISCLLSLAYWQHYPHDLLNLAMETSFIALLNESEFRDLLVIDCSVEIEAPEYQGNRLEKKLRLSLWQKYKARIPDSTMTSFFDKLLINVDSKLSALLHGNHFTVIQPALPHFQLADILLCLNLNGKPLCIDSKFHGAFSLQPVPTDSKWICIVIGGKNCYTTENEPVGHMTMKLRQLKRLGYQVIEIPWFEYYDEKNLKYSYLQQKLEQVIDL